MIINPALDVYSNGVWQSRPTTHPLDVVHVSTCCEHPSSCTGGNTVDVARVQRHNERCGVAP